MNARGPRSQQRLTRHGFVIRQHYTAAEPRQRAQRDAMQIRPISFLLLVGCRAADTDALAVSERTERTRVVFSDREASAGSAACERDACIRTGAVVRSRLQRERNVRISTGEPESPPLDITIELPITVVDCSQVQLSLMGPWHAALEESIVLEAVASGTDDQSTLAWQMMGGEVTVLGPLTAAIKCTEPGAHTVSVEFAPPAPCPSTLEVEIDCDAPAEP